MNNVLEFFIKMKDLMSGGLTRLAQNAQSSLTKVQSFIDNTVRKNKQLGDSFDDVGRKAKNSSSSISSWAKGLGMAAAIAGTLSFGQGMLTKGLQAQARQASFEVMAGKEGGTRLNKDLTAYAQDSIYGNEVYQNAQTMMGFGMNVKDVLPNMKMLGDIAMGDSNKLNSLTLAFSQVQAAGRLTGQDLLQFINAGFNPLNEISKLTGLSIGDLKKKMEDGAISADMITTAFRSATGPGGQFYQMTEKIAQTDYGKWQAFQGQLEGVATQIGGAVAPAFGTLIGWLSSTVTWLQENWNWLGLVVTIAGTLAAVIGVVTGATQLWTWATGVLNKVMAMNPIMRVVLIVSALIAAIVYAYQKFGWFRGAVYAAWETIKGFGLMLKDYVIDRIKGIISGLGGLASAIIKFFKGDFSGAWETAKQAGKDLIGVDAAQKAAGRMKEIGKAAGVAYQRGLAEVNNKSSKSDTSVTASEAASPGGNMADVFASLKNGKSGGGSGGSDVAKGITGGGPRVINITIGKMVEKIEIVSNGVQGAYDDVERRVEEVFLRILNSGAAVQ